MPASISGGIGLPGSMPATGGIVRPGSGMAGTGMRLPGGITVWSGSVKRPALRPITTPKTTRTRAPPTSAAGWRSRPRPAGGAGATAGCRLGRRRCRAQRIERAEDLRRAALVARAQRLVVVVGQMPGFVVEGELAERAIDGRLLLAELEGGVPRGDPAGGIALAPARHERPEDEGEGRDDDQGDGDGLGRAHRFISFISRWMRAFIAWAALTGSSRSSHGGCALSSPGPRSPVHLVDLTVDARPHRLVHGNGGCGRAAGRSPGPAAHEDRQHDEARRASPANGTIQTSRLKPWRGGARRIQSPYLSTK